MHGVNVNDNAYDGVPDVYDGVVWLLWQALLNKVDNTKTPGRPAGPGEMGGPEGTPGMPPGMMGGPLDQMLYGPRIPVST